MVGSLGLHRTFELAIFSRGATTPLKKIQFDSDIFGKDSMLHKIVHFNKNKHRLTTFNIDRQFYRSVQLDFITLVFR